MNAQQLINLADTAAKVVSAATSLVTTATEAFERGKADLAITDVQTIQSRLADAHAETLRLSRILDDKLAAASRR